MLNIQQSEAERMGESKSNAETDQSVYEGLNSRNGEKKQTYTFLTATTVWILPSFFGRTSNFVSTTSASLLTYSKISSTLSL